LSGWSIEHRVAKPTPSSNRLLSKTALVYGKELWLATKYIGEWQGKEKQRDQDVEGEGRALSHNLLLTNL